MKHAFQKFSFRATTLSVIETANAIIAEYQADGYDLTLRQLYYQFVARGIISNSDKEYNRLGSIVNNARLAGLISWRAIVDRTRQVRGNSHWDSPAEIIQTCAKQYRLDTRIDQPYYIEVWVEKDALIGVLERVCTDLDVRYFSCRGYVSQSAMFEAAYDRFMEEAGNHDKQVIVLHLGDHDPSGIDMTRDIQKRLEMFGCNALVNRIALNMDQVEQYSPPPNPAKLTDSRCGTYMNKYGNKSWELDALDPKVITSLIKKEVDGLTDEDLRIVRLKQQKKDRRAIQEIADNWPNKP